MGDKPDIFDNIQLIFPPIGGAGTLICTVKEDTVLFEEPPTASPLFSAPEIGMQLSLVQSFVDLILLGNQGEERECEVSIQALPRVRKPKNLKYPRKKRAYRLLSKWRNRYGIEPGKTYTIPQAKIVKIDDNNYQATAIETPKR